MTTAWRPQPAERCFSESEEGDGVEIFRPRSNTSSDVLPWLVVICSDTVGPSQAIFIEKIHYVYRDKSDQNPHWLHMFRRISEQLGKSL